MTSFKDSFCKFIIVSQQYLLRWVPPILLEYAIWLKQKIIQYGQFTQERLKKYYLTYVPENKRLVIEKRANQLRTPLKRTAKIAGISFVGFHLILFICTTVINPNLFKEGLQALVQDKTGYLLILEGPLSWKSFPSLMVEAKDVVVKKKLESSKALCSAQSIRIRPRLLPLLLGKVDLRISMEDATVQGKKLAHVFSRIIYRNQKLKLKGLEIDLIHAGQRGTIEVDYLSLDHRGEVPKYRVRHEGNDFQLPLILSMLDLKAKITGETNLSCDLKAEGKNRHAILNSLEGACELEIAHGHVHGINLIFALKEAKSLVGTMASKISGAFGELFDALLHRKSQELTGTTPFQHAKVKITLQNGLMTLHHLSIIHPHFHLKGKGGMNLMNQAIDYHLEAQYKEHGTINHAVTHRKHMAPLVVRITGSVSKPKIKADFDSYMQYVRQGDGKKVKRRNIFKSLW